MKTPSVAPASRQHPLSIAVVRFALLGLVSYGLLLGGTAAGVELAGLPPRAAYGVILTLVLVWNFYANRRFIFPASRGGGAGGQAVRFVAASTGFRVLEYLLVTGLMLDFMHLPYPLAITLGAGLMLGGKYIVFSRYVFGARGQRNAEATRLP